MAAPRAVVRRTLAGAGVLALVLAGVCVVRACGLESRQVEPTSALALELDPLAAAERLAGSLRAATISHPDRFAAAPFQELHAYLVRTFPTAHRALELEPIGDHSLLYTWRGTDPTLAPLVLLAHQDVVAVDPGREGAWTHPPFAGVVAEGWVWGRGALDDKGPLVAIFEAVEHLLGAGFAPQRTVLLAFGHDEEIGGAHGAAVIAQTLAARGVAPLMVLDEGGTVLAGTIPSVEAPVAFVGVAEKGYANLELAVEAPGGHSSRPPEQSAIGILARAVERVEARPLPADLGPVTGAMLDHLAPETGFSARLVLANRWLWDPLLSRALGASPDAAPMVRTTAAATIVEGGVQENVLPRRARAVINFRLAPGDTVDAVVAHVERVVDDPRVTVRVVGEPREASPISVADGEAWTLLARTIREIHDGAVVVPFLVPGGTDARHYRALSDAVYRFKPGLATPDLLERMHGTDERVAIEDHALAIRFYVRLIEQAAGG